MVRSILAMVGLLTLLAGLAIWQFGFFSKKVQEVTNQIERETAVARAEGMIRDTERRAAELTEKARKLRIDARAKELAVEREAAQVQKTRLALAALANAAREAGLPKPTEAGEDDLKKTLVFAGRSLTGAELYHTLERWQADVQRDERKVSTTTKLTDRIRVAADQLESKQRKMVASVSDVRTRLDELNMQRDLAKVEQELAELGANLRGDFAGDLGRAMDTLQKEIDELQATSEVLGKQPDQGPALTPDDVLAGQQAELSVQQQLDTLWETPAGKAKAKAKAKAKN
ncbi:MAG: hypothetical protein NTY19_25845 [Planctomycetota bacterium]|nr:hypothetical protein [Planctomycetota bacterium]